MQKYKIIIWNILIMLIIVLSSCDDWFDATLIIENNSRTPANVRVSSYGKPSGGWTLINEYSKASFRVESGNTITIELYTNSFITISPLEKGEERIYTLGGGVPTW